MPTDNISSNEFETAIASFRASCSLAPPGEVLHLPSWGDDEWRQLFGCTKIRRVKAGDALIRGGESDKTLYFVLKGSLEVILHSSDGLTMGRVGLVPTGSVLGEIAFFDGGPRSGSAWAIDDCEVAAMSPERYAAFEESTPTLAHELLYALGRILAIRLRSTNAKVVQ